MAASTADPGVPPVSSPDHNKQSPKWRRIERCAAVLAIIIAPMAGFELHDWIVIGLIDKQTVELTKKSGDILTEVKNVEEVVNDIRKRRGEPPLQFTEQQESEAVNVVAQSFIGTTIYMYKAAMKSKYCPNWNELIKNSLLYDIKYAPDCVSLGDGTVMMVRAGVPGELIVDETGMVVEKYPSCETGNTITVFGFDHGEYAINKCPNLSLPWMAGTILEGTTLNPSTFKSETIKEVEKDINYPK